MSTQNETGSLSLGVEQAAQSNQTRGVGESNGGNGRKCTCGKKPGATGRHKDGCALRQPGVTRHKSNAPRQTASPFAGSDARFAPLEMEEQPGGNVGSSQEPGETRQPESGNPVVSLVPADSRHRLLAEAFTGICKGTARALLGQMRSDAVVLGGEAFANETLKDAAITAEEFDRICSTGEAIARKYDIDFGYIEEVAFGTAVVSPFARLIYAARKLHAKAEEVLKLQREQAQQNGGAQ